MKTIFVSLLIGHLLTLAAQAQFVSQPGLSEVTVIETWRGVQHVTSQTISVTRNGRMEIRIRRMRGSAAPLGGAGRLTGRMEPNGSFTARGRLNADGRTVTLQGKVRSNGRFSITREIEDEPSVKLEGRSVVGGFSLTGSYTYTLDENKV